MPQSFMNRLRRELRALIELFIVPIAIALMPWWLGFRVARRLAHLPWFHRERVAASLVVAARYGVIDDPKRFAFEQRLYHIIDQADIYLVKLRSDRYLDRHFDIDGDWPEGTGALITLSFHWGAGIWGLRSLRRRGRRFAILSARHDAQVFKGQSVMYLYSKVRINEGLWLSGNPFVYIGDGPRPMLRALQSGVSLLTSIDVPHAGGEVPVRLLGRDAKLANGMIRLAEKSKVPIVFFAVWIDLATGRRKLRIREALQVTDRDEAMRVAAAHLDWMLATAPAAWHFWAYADAFFVDAATSQTAAVVVEQEDTAPA